MYYTSCIRQVLASIGSNHVLILILQLYICINSICSNVYIEYIDPSLPVTCGEPPAVEHATHDGEPEQKSYPTGQQLMYSCAYGYSKNGHPRAMCSGEGQWVGLSLTCSRTFD